MKKMFRKEHIGQPVYSDQSGAGTIVSVDESGVYPVRVKYSTVPSMVVYTQDGRCAEGKPPVLMFGTGHSYGEPERFVKYWCAGRVQATPMTLENYVASLGLESRDVGEKGYLVKCLVDPKLVHWQPAEQFHNTHIKIPSKGE